jgi:hypothetical protein
MPKANIARIATMLRAFIAELGHAASCIFQRITIKVVERADDGYRDKR